MRDLILHPLLQGDDIVGAIIFFVIWGVIAILSQVGKWQEKKRQREQEMRERQVHGGPPPVPGQVQIPQRSPQQPSAARRPQQPQRRRPQEPPPRRPTPIIIEERPIPAYRPPAEPSAPVAGEIGSSTEGTKTAPTISARQLRQVLQPRNVRKQFIILELLQPPLSIRQQDHR